MKNDIETEVRKALEKSNVEELDIAVSRLLQTKNISTHIDLLNELLLTTVHHQHQYIARAIQELKTPSSIPFIRKILQSEFEGIPYTGSDSNSMAKWFSWALYCIGTEEAIGVIKENVNSSDEGIREEMQYRLEKINLENS